MALKYQPWEFLAIDLVYLDKDPVTVALVPRTTVDVYQWLQEHLKPATQPHRHVGVYAYPVTLQ